MNDHSPAGAILSLAEELAEVGRLVDDDDIPATMRRFVQRAVDTLPGCDHAAITISTATDSIEIGSAGNVDLPFPGGEAAMPNPIAETLRYHEARRLNDVETDPRWSLYSYYLSRHGLRSCLCLPLPAAAEVSAAFTVFSAKPHQFSEEGLDLVLLFTLHAGVAFDNVSLYHDSRQLIGHLQTALRTRTVIAQAQGLLMRRHDWDEDRAFAALKETSQQHNIKLRTLTTTLVEAHHTDRLDAVLADYQLMSRNIRKLQQ